MDIKKLTTQINGTHPARKGSSPAGSETVGGKRDKEEDKLSLDSYSFRQNELLFARSEYNKQSQTSFEKLREMKTRLDEYISASNISIEKASETEIGKKLNDPLVWEKIARKIMDT